MHNDGLHAREQGVTDITDDGAAGAQSSGNRNRFVETHP
jgi:hypothetical protein